MVCVCRQAVHGDDEVAPPRDRPILILIVTITLALALTLIMAMIVILMTIIIIRRRTFIINHTPEEHTLPVVMTCQLLLQQNVTKAKVSSARHP